MRLDEPHPRGKKKGPGIKGSDTGPKNALWPVSIHASPRAPAQGGKRETLTVCK